MSAWGKLLWQMRSARREQMSEVDRVWLQSAACSVGRSACVVSGVAGEW